MSLNHQEVFVLWVVDLHSVFGVEFLVGETCQKPMSPIRYPDAAPLPRPRVGWPSNVPFDGASPYPSQIQFVQEDPVFPRFRHVTVESMWRNSRPARAGREQRKAVEGSNDPACKIRRRLAKIRYKDSRPAACPSSSRPTRAMVVNESYVGAREAAEAWKPEVDDDNLCSREAIQQLLRVQDHEFNRRLLDSETRQWCNRVPRELVLSSVQFFYQDLQSRTTLATGHCHLCQQMTAPDDLLREPWQGLLPQGSAIRSLVETSGALECRECLPVSPVIGVLFCSSCYKALVARQ